MKGFKPALVMKAAVAEWAADNMNNPRADVGRILVRIDKTGILADFNKRRESIDSYSSSRGQRTSGGKPTSGPEFLLRDKTQRLTGRADAVIAGGILEQKSGEELPEHFEQVRFYCALFLESFDRVPSFARVEYGMRNTVELKVPSQETLSCLIDKYRKEAADNDAHIRDGTLQSKPQADTCRYCTVKGICRDCQLAGSSAGFSEIEISRGTDWRKAGHSWISRLGNRTVVVAENRLHPTQAPTNFHVRMLGAQVRNGRINASERTEIYLL